MSLKYIQSLALCSSMMFLLILSGCETEPSEQAALTITPNNVSIRLGESQEFTATGWQDYTWEIVGSENQKREKRGVLSSRKGPSTVYTAVAGTNEIVVLRVSANLHNQSTTTMEPGSTSRVSAEALITHLP